MAPAVDVYMRALYQIEQNAQTTRRHTIMDWLSGGKPDVQTVPEARGSAHRTF